MLQIVLLALGVVHGLYLAYALYRQTETNPANRYLSGLILASSVILASILADLTGIERQWPHLVGLSQAIDFLPAPLLYFYVCTQCGLGDRLNYRKHLMPSALILLLFLPFYLQSSEAKIDFLSYEPSIPLNQFYLSVSDQVTVAALILQLALYIALCWQVLAQHQQRIEQLFSYRANVALLWLRRLVNCLALLLALLVIDNMIEILDMNCIHQGTNVYCQTDFWQGDREWYLVEIGLVLCIYTISIYGLRQPIIYASIPSEVEQSKSSADTKYQHSSLDKQLANRVFQEVDQKVKGERLHLEPELSLMHLSQATGFSKHHLSQAINQVAEQNFFDYINAKRVESAKELILKQPDMTVLDISLAAGFQSRSAFYNAFKRTTNLTPGQFKHQQNCLS